MRYRLVRFRGIGFAFVLAVSGTAAVSARPAAAWCFQDISKWATGYANSTPRVHWNPSASYRNAISISVSDWNGIDTIAYPSPIFNTTTYGNFDMYMISFAGAGWQDAPGLTFNNSDSSPHTVSDLYLNNDYFWYTDGTMNQIQHKADMRTVTTHEVGHSSGLAHPDKSVVECLPETTAEKAAVMNLNWTQKWGLRADDIQGIQRRYP